MVLWNLPVCLVLNPLKGWDSYCFFQFSLFSTDLQVGAACSDRKNQLMQNCLLDVVCTGFLFILWIFLLLKALINRDEIRSPLKSVVKFILTSVKSYFPVFGLQSFIHAASLVWVITMWASNLIFPYVRIQPTDVNRGVSNVLSDLLGWVTWRARGCPLMNSNGAVGTWLKHSYSICLGQHRALESYYTEVPVLILICLHRWSHRSLWHHYCLINIKLEGETNHQFI